MKNSVKLPATLLTLGLSAITLAQVAGTPISAAVTVEIAAGVYTAALLGLMLVHDYSRGPAARKPAVAAPSVALACESHRLAA